MGKEIASEILAANTWFRDSPERVSQVLWLIEHHDDTTYSFPSVVHNGRPVLTGHIQQDGHLTTPLAVLQEADSGIHVLDACIQEAWQEWLRQDVPLFSGNGAPLETWRWMDSVIGNTRLLGKRSILDAHTEGGTFAAQEAYERLEDLIRSKCGIAGIPYEPEVCPPTMRRASLAVPVRFI